MYFQITELNYTNKKSPFLLYLSIIKISKLKNISCFHLKLLVNRWLLAPDFGSKNNFF
jgi:hypothetical protein